MKNICKMSLIVLGLAFYASALVHFIKLEKGENGCMGQSGELAVGAYEQDEKTCGVIVCQNTEGDALIHFCQQPATFQQCSNNTVSLTTDFPDCCWQCTRCVDCSESTTEA